MFFSVTTGYKSILYLGGTLRNDKSSALPVDNNSYLYYSLNTSLILSEILDLEWLSFAKFRAAVAQVGSDTHPYQTTQFFNTGISYATLASFNVPDELYNANIKPAIATSHELGIEMRFIKNRVGFELTYYLEDNKNQILSLQVPGPSGYLSALVNAGLIQDKGIEFSIQGVPVKESNFTWNLSFNIARNRSRVLALAEGLSNYALSRSSFWSLDAPVGGDWGTWTGRKIQRRGGQPVIDEGGQYLYDPNQKLGKILPDFTGGLINSIRISNFEISALLSFQIGGDIFSYTHKDSHFSGVAKATAVLNDKGNSIRDPVDQGGGVRVTGVLSDGSSHEVYVPAQQYFENLAGVDEMWIYDASYIKIREIRIGYSTPKSLLKGIFFKKLKVSTFAQNLCLLYSNIDGLDPSEISIGRNPYTGFDLAPLPSVRSFGISLQAEF